MEESTDVQGTIIGVGTLAVIVTVAYGTLFNESIVGIDTMVLAGWLFTATLLGVAAAHAHVKQYDLTWGFTGVAVGWIFILTGSGARAAIGLGLLLLSGVYIALVTVRLRREDR